MKEYTTGEIILALEKNPKLQFRSSNHMTTPLMAYSDGEAIFYRKENGSFSEQTGMALNRKWTLVRTPVTWQEAIQAWLDGKTVRCECKECGYCLFQCPFDDRFCGKGFKSGVWFIGDADE